MQFNALIIIVVSFVVVAFHCTDAQEDERVRDFYIEQARSYLSGQLPAPRLLPGFPGIDGEHYGHWGKFDRNIIEQGWNTMDLGGLVSAVTTHFGVTTTKAVLRRLSDSSSHAALFDASRLTFTEIWRGDFVKFKEQRLGVMDNAVVAGERWIDLKNSTWNVVDGEELRYRGFYRHGTQAVFSYEIGETKILDAIEESDGVLSRTISVSGALPRSSSLTLLRTDVHVKPLDIEGLQTLTLGSNVHIAVRSMYGGIRLVSVDTGSGKRDLRIDFGSNENSCRLRVGWIRGNGEAVKDRLRRWAASPDEDLSRLTKGGPPQWANRSCVTRGQLGAVEGAYAIDTLALPHHRLNPFGTPFRPGGLDFLPDGRAVVATLTGDIWLVSGVDSDLDRLEWKRIAAGLHQPLGVLVQDGSILVTGRDQITRLHDLNNDEEIDFYECVTNGYKTLPGHSFVTCLHDDDDGNLYFFSPAEGVLKYRNERSEPELEVLGHGLRNSNGMNVNRDGTIVLATAQEGTWTPATAIFEVGSNSYHGSSGPQGNGKYGYDLPLCFVPRGIDTSAGELTFLPRDERLGALSGCIVGLSHGNCSHYVVLRETVGNVVQGGVLPLPGEFLAGAHRLRYNPHDGHVYVAGVSGWADYSREVGSLQRLRPTSKPLHFPTSVETRQNGFVLRYDCAIERESLDIGKVFCQRWNYAYSKAYGSAEYSVEMTELKKGGRLQIEDLKPGHDYVAVRSLHLLPDGQSVFVEIPNLHPAMQLHLYLDLAARSESVPAQFTTDLYYSVFALGEPFIEFDGYQATATDPAPDFPAVEIYAADPRLVAQEELGEFKKEEMVSIEMRAVSGLRFEPDWIQVPPGKRIALTIRNEDVSMPHNFVLVESGALERVGAAADLLAADPQGIAKHYVPESSNSILSFSPVIDPGEAYTVYFDSPDAPGEFPFACTFPGHWRVMRGNLVVNDKIARVNPASAPDSSREFVKMWTVEDLAEKVESATEGSVSRGRTIFNEAGCVNCHAFGGIGSAIGPDLTKVTEHYKGRKLLEQIIDPSSDIRASYETKLVTDTNGDVYAGMIVGEDKEGLLVRTNPTKPDVVKIPFDSIADVRASETSTMPEGLLMIFEEDEILDLLWFLQSGGGGAE